MFFSAHPIPRQPNYPEGTFCKQGQLLQRSPFIHPNEPSLGVWGGQSRLWLRNAQHHVQKTWIQSRAPFQSPCRQHRMRMRHLEGMSKDGIRSSGVSLLRSNSKPPKHSPPQFCSQGMASTRRYHTNPSPPGADSCLPKSHPAQQQRDPGRDGAAERADGDSLLSAKTASWGQRTQPRVRGPALFQLLARPSEPQFPHLNVKGLG